MDEVYPDAQRVTWVCDNLNTHSLKSLSKAFPAEEADRLSSRLEIVYTPKHGSWLNIAEIELSVFSRQCLNRRIPDIETLRAEAAAWQKHRNQTANTVDWRFTTQDARIKLKRLSRKLNIEAILAVLVLLKNCSRYCQKSWKRELKSPRIARIANQDAPMASSLLSPTILATRK